MRKMSSFVAAFVALTVDATKMRIVAAAVVSFCEKDRGIVRYRRFARLFFFADELQSAFGLRMIESSFTWLQLFRPRGIFNRLN